MTGIHWLPVNSPHKVQWRGASMFSLISGWANKRDAGDLRRQRAHYDVTVMVWVLEMSGSERFWYGMLMMLWHGNAFRMTSPLWGKSPVTSGFPSRANTDELLCFFVVSLNCTVAHVLFVHRWGVSQSLFNGAHMTSLKCEGVAWPTCYRKTPDLSRSSVGNKVVDNSDVVGASPVGAAPTTSSFSTQQLASMDWAKTTARGYKKHLNFGIWCDLY